MPQDETPDQTSTYIDSIQKLKPGTTLASRYKIVRLIGSGGMGRVYLAHDDELGIDVALKVIRRDLLDSQSTIDRFKNELLIARKVSHRNVVRIHDIGQADGEKYLTMSYIPGKSLKEVLKESGPLSPQKAEEVALQLCEAIAVAHEEGVIHRDLKPANILLEENGRVFVTDFGIARSLEFSGGTETGHIVGTPAYLSPEQARGEHVDARSDVYSLGLILYEMAAGELPFDNQSVNRFRNSGPGDLESKLKKNQPEIPTYYADIIKRCLNPNPEMRYPNARPVLEDLQSKKAKRTPLKISRAATLAGILILLIVGVIAFRQFLYNPSRTSPAKPQEESQVVPIARAMAVLPFSNRTGNDEMKWIESALADLLTTDLSQDSAFRIVSSERIHQTLQDLKYSAQTLDDNTALKLAELLDAELMVQGSIAQAGTLLRADVKVTDVSHPGSVMYFKSTGQKPEDVFGMTENLARQIREQLQSGGTQNSKTPQASVLPVAALKFFHQGNDQFRQGNFSDAVPLYESAAKEAPSFARAYLQLSFAYEKMGQPQRSVEALEQSMQEESQDEKTNLMIRARHSLLSGDLDKAVETYSVLTQKDPDDSETLFQLATTYEEKGDLKNASAALTKVVALDPNHPQAYFHLGKDTVLMGDAEKGINQYLLKALAVQTQLNNEYGKADVLNAIGVAYERLGRYEDAIRHYNDSIAIKERIGNKKGEAKSLTNVAKIHLYQGKYDEATKILNRTSQIYAKLQDPAGESDVLNLFGVMNEDQGKFDEALQYYKKAMQIRKQIGNDRLTAQSYDNVGQIYYLKGQHDDAEVYWKQALSLRKQIGEESGVILSLQNMGFLQLDQGKLDQSLKSFLDALDQSRKIKYENAIAVSLGNLGTIYQYQGRYGAAIDSYKEAIEILKNLKDKKGVAEYSRLLGSVFLETNNLLAAEPELKNSLQLAKEIQSFEMQTDTETLFARLYMMKEDIEQAQRHVEEALKIAEEHHYENGSLKAGIVNGLILARSNQPESITILQRAVKMAGMFRNVWLSLESRCAFAHSLLKNGDAAGAIDTAQSALVSAEHTASLPYQYRLHSILGSAFQLKGEHQKAQTHFQQANQSLDTILKSMKPDDAAQFQKHPDVEQVVRGLKETKN